MTKLFLKRHPSSTPGAANRIEAEVGRSAGGALALRYRIEGDIEGLLIPTPAAPDRTDGLWQHTCFEAFVRRAEGYYEFNFSPSGQWAAYRFAGYREGMAPADIEPPTVGWNPAKAELDVSLRLPVDASGLASFSAVIEEKDGAKSYWALGHPPGKPDFHHADCFVLELPPAKDA